MDDPDTVLVLDHEAEFVPVVVDVIDLERRDECVGVTVEIGVLLLLGLAEVVRDTDEEGENVLGGVPVFDEDDDFDVVIEGVIVDVVVLDLDTLLELELVRVALIVGVADAEEVLERVEVLLPDSDTFAVDDLDGRVDVVRVVELEAERVALEDRVVVFVINGVDVLKLLLELVREFVPERVLDGLTETLLERAAVSVPDAVLVLERVCNRLLDALEDAEDECVAFNELEDVLVVLLVRVA